MNPAEAPTAKTQNLISIIFEIRQASLKSDFQNKLDTALIRRVGNTRNEEYFSGQAVYFMAANRKNKEERKWVGPGIIVGRFGNKYALVHFRGSYFEFDLEDVRPANSLFGIIGCGGTCALT